VRCVRAIHSASGRWPPGMTPGSGR
jgi:hypothetical protein